MADDASTDDEFSFGYVSKRARQETSGSTTQEAVKRRTVYEKERDAKAAAALAQLAPLAETGVNTREPEDTPKMAFEDGGETRTMYTRGGRGGRGGRRGYGAPREPPTKVQLNRIHNFHLTRNVLLEVDVESRQPMELAVVPGSAAAGSVPQYRSTNRFAQRGGSGGGRGRGGWTSGGEERGGYRGSRGRGGGGYRGYGHGSERRARPGRELTVVRPTSCFTCPSTLAIHGHLFMHRQPPDGPPQPAKRPRVELSARERFLQELAKCASDDDAQDSAPDRAPARDPTPADVSQGTAATRSSFFFGGPDHAEENSGHDRPTRAGGRLPVGSALLMGMHRSLTADQGLHGAPAEEWAMVKVHAYAPLSSGGFLDTDAANADLASIRIGDVMVALRIPGQSRSPPPTGAGAPVTATAARPATAGLPTVPQAQGGEGRVLPDPSAAAASAPMTSARDGGLSRFRAEADMSEDERRYGRRPTAEMLAHLFTVARLDRATQAIEGVFLDGTRAKLRLTDARPAGFVERELFRQWQRDPSSRPVPRITATTGEPPAQGPVSPSEGEDAAGNAEPRTAATHWWVLPNLLVRVVASEAGEWLGAKCVVVAVRRAEGAVRLVRSEVWEQQQQQQREGRPQGRPRPATAAADAGSSGATVEVVGLAGLETVLPKKGEAGMIVLGEHKGDMAVVLARLRGPDGDLIAVDAQCTRTSAVLRLKPQELCAVARR